MKIEAAIVYCTFPDAKCARDIARTLVEEKLAACANVSPEVESIFIWEGKCSSKKEATVVFKTTAKALDKLIVRLGECHPYDTPAIVGWRCDATHPLTLQWLAQASG